MRLAATFASAIAIGSALAAGTALLSGQARAADYYPPVPHSSMPGLPAASGPQDFNWGGLYGGIYGSYTAGEFSATTAGSNFSNNATYSAPPVSLPLPVSLAPITFAGPSDSRGGFGGFIGYNWLWDDVVVGLEGDFTMAGLKGTATTAFDQLSPTGNIAYRVAGTATNQFKMDNYAVLKLRAGAPMGRLMPYATAGLAIGDATANASFGGTMTTYSVASNLYTPIAVNSLTPQYVSKSSTLLGAALGVGLDYAILDNVILRAEYQFIAFNKLLGQQATLNVVKAGIGLKY